MLYQRPSGIACTGVVGAGFRAQRRRRLLVLLQHNHAGTLGSAAIGSAKPGARRCYARTAEASADADTSDTTVQLLWAKEQELRSSKDEARQLFRKAQQRRRDLKKQLLTDRKASAKVIATLEDQLRQLQREKDELRRAAGGSGSAEDNAPDGKGKTREFASIADGKGPGLDNSKPAMNVTTDIATLTEHLQAMRLASHSLRADVRLLTYQTRKGDRIPRQQAAKKLKDRTKKLVALQRAVGKQAQASLTTHASRELQQTQSATRALAGQVYTQIDELSGAKEKGTRVTTAVLRSKVEEVIRLHDVACEQVERSAGMSEKACKNSTASSKQTSSIGADLTDNKGETSKLQRLLSEKRARWHQARQVARMHATAATAPPASHKTNTNGATTSASGSNGSKNNKNAPISEANHRRQSPAIIEERRRASKARYDAAVREQQTLRKPFGRIRWAISSWWSGSDALAGVASTELPAVSASSWEQGWIFAQQPLSLPADRGWPPQLPTYLDFPPGATLQDVTGMSAEYLGDVYACRTPRELTALALALTRYGAPPHRHIERKMSSTARAASASAATKAAEEAAPETHVRWKPILSRDLSALGPREQAWVSENFSRLELLGDGLVRGIALRTLFFRFPNMNSSGLILAAAHLGMNDTFVKMFEISGLQEFQEKLAYELFEEAIDGQKAALQGNAEQQQQSPTNVVESRTQLALRDQGTVPADLFEAYLAYVHIVHGPQVAEEWFAALAEPWIRRIENDAAFIDNPKNVTDAGAVRIRHEGRFGRRRQRRPNSAGGIWSNLSGWMFGRRS